MKINVILRDTDIDLNRLSGDFAGVDRGVYTLINSGIIPNFSYGDFDSVNSEEIAVIKKYIDINVVTSEKNYTDTELALLSLVGKGYKKIVVYGALGGRIDHEFMNIQLLLHNDLVECDIRYVNSLNEIFVINKQSILENKGYQYVSFIPVYNNTHLTLTGFKYDGNISVDIGNTLTVSNEFKESYGTVIPSKAIIVIYSNDRR